MLIFKTLGLGALQVEVARRALLRVARGPVLGLAGLAAVAALAAGARGQRRVARVGLETANVTCSPIPLPSFTAYWPVALPIRSLPIRSLTFDTTIALVAASATDSESRRVEGKLARTALGKPVFFCRPRSAQTCADAVPGARLPGVPRLGNPAWATTSHRRDKNTRYEQLTVSR